MNYKNTIEILLKDISEIERIINNFKKYKQIPQIEMDLTLSKVRNLYDILLLLEKSNSELSIDKQEKEIKEKEIFEIKVETIQESKNETLEVENIKIEQEKEKDDAVELIIPEKEKTAEDAIKNPVSKKEVKIEKTIEIKQPEYTKNAIISEKGIVADKFQNGQNSINETLAQQIQKMDLSTKFQLKPISNIAKAIGVNDKFLFIKELFNNNSAKYNETIKILNNSTDFEEAIYYLSDNFDWDANNPAVIKIVELIRRKYLAY